MVGQPPFQPLHSPSSPCQASWSFPFSCLFPQPRGITVHWWVCLRWRSPWEHHWGFCIHFGDTGWWSGGCPSLGSEHRCPAVPWRRGRTAAPHSSGLPGRCCLVRPVPSGWLRTRLHGHVGGSGAATRILGQLGEEVKCHLIAIGNTCTSNGSRSMSPEACPINVTAGTADMAGCWLFLPSAISVSCGSNMLKIEQIFIFCVTENFYLL